MYSFRTSLMYTMASETLDYTIQVDKKSASSPD